MSLILHEQTAALLKLHAERLYPEECGGLLLGSEENGVRRICRHIELPNQEPTNRGTRFSAHPGDYIEGEALARELGLSIWGFYHSHPDQAAEPSSRDLEHACFDNWSYLIASVNLHRVVQLKSWTLNEIRSSFTEETIAIIGENLA